jgi:hypothetical protein
MPGRRGQGRGRARDPPLRSVPTKTTRRADCEMSIKPPQPMRSMGPMLLTLTSPRSSTCARTRRLGMCCGASRHRPQRTQQTAWMPVAAPGWGAARRTQQQARSWRQPGARGAAKASLRGARGAPPGLAPALTRAGFRRSANGRMEAAPRASLRRRRSAAPAGAAPRLARRARGAPATCPAPPGRRRPGAGPSWTRLAGARPRTAPRQTASGRCPRGRGRPARRRRPARPPRSPAPRAPRARAARAPRRSPPRRPAAVRRRHAAGFVSAQ